MNVKLSCLVLLFIIALVACATSTTTPTPTPLLPTTAVPASMTWSLVAIGDSIAYNIPLACPSCTGFVDRYATAISNTTGHSVKVENLSLRGIQIDYLLSSLKNDQYLRSKLANADVILVGIAHNDVAWLRDDDPCDGPNNDKPDWSKYNATCAAVAAEIFRPKFESVYAQIVALREGKPTVFRTINRYNDWIGSTREDLPPAATAATRDILDAWNAMICKTAQTNGFVCADIYHTFNGPDGLTPSADLLGRDYIHPSDKGNEVISRVLVNLGLAPLAP